VCVCVYVYVCACVCVCVCLLLLLLAGATSPLQAKVRHQQKALNVRNKMNVGLELKILSSIVMTVKVKQGNLEQNLDFVATCYISGLCWRS